jgi:hypothetical protein
MTHWRSLAESRCGRYDIPLISPRRPEPGRPPGPRSIPLLGDAVIKLIAEGSRYHRRMFRAWGPTFSDTVAGSRVIFISRHEDIKKVLGSEHELVKGEAMIWAPCDGPM